MHLNAKFHHPTFNRSEVIMRTDKQTNKHSDKQTPMKISTSLRYATPANDNTVVQWVTASFAKIKPSDFSLT